MDEDIVEEWTIVDQWWTDKPIRREYKVLTNGTTWMRQLIEEDNWSDWQRVVEQ